MNSNGTVYATRDLILGMADVEYRDVEVPEWKCVVRVRSISAADRERLMRISVVTEGRGKDAKQRFDMPTFRTKLAALAMVDADGTRLFTDGDVSELGKRNARAMERVSDVALELCGVTDDSEDGDDDAGKADSSRILLTAPVSTSA